MLTIVNKTTNKITCNFIECLIDTLKLKNCMDQKIGVFGTGSIPLLVKIQKKCKNMSSFFISCKIVQYLSNDALLLNSSSTKQREATSCSYGSSNKQGKKRTFFIYLPHIGLDQPHSTPLSLHKLFTAPNISPTSAFYR